VDFKEMSMEYFKHSNIIVRIIKYIYEHMHAEWGKLGGEYRNLTNPERELFVLTTRTYNSIKLYDIYCIILSFWLLIIFRRRL
jgi:hypothetical protein